MLTTFSDLHMTVEDALEADDRVVGRFNYRGAHQAEFIGISGTGRPFEMKPIDIWRLENGVVVEHWDGVNTFEVFQQLGALPSPEEMLASTEELLAAHT